MQKVWLAVPLKINANGEGQGECRLHNEEKEDAADTRSMTLAALAAAEQRKESERDMLLPRHVAGLYKHDLSN